jgi:hypothetical protein
MVSALIFLLAVITAALVVGVFVMTFIELNHIDEISEQSHSPGRH